MDEDVARYALVAAALAGHAAIEDAVPALCATSPGTPYRGALAAALVGRLLSRDVRQLFPIFREIDALIVIADAGPPSDGSWPRLRALARGIALGAAAAVHDLRDPVAALAEIEALAAGLDEDDTQARTLLESARLAIEMAQGIAGRDDLINSEFWERLRGMVAAAGDDDSAAVRGEMVEAMRELAADPAGDLPGRLEQFRRGAARLPDGDPMRAAVDEAVAQLTHLVTGDPGLLRSPLSPNETALHHAATGLRLLQEGGGPAGLDEGVEHMRAALAAADPDHPQRVFHLNGLALALMRRTEYTNDIAGLPEAERLLVEAQGLLAGPQDDAWSMVHELLADVRQRLGTGSGSYVDAVEAVRSHVWQVLMQPDAAGASAAARKAAESAVAAAHRCLRDNDVAGAVRALDAGRGLAL